MLCKIVKAEPLKKRKRMDPAIEQNRMRRKTKRIEKEIKRLNRFDRVLMPIEELEGDRQLMKDLSIRKRPKVDLSESEVDRRALLLKQWSAFQTKVASEEFRKYRSAIQTQQKALNLLQHTRPDLYKAAIQLCPTTTTTGTSDESSGNTMVGKLLPITLNGPYTTAPLLFGDQLAGNADYDPPDGEWEDITPKIRYDFELHKQFVAEPKKKKPM